MKFNITTVFAANEIIIKRILLAAVASLLSTTPLFAQADKMLPAVPPTGNVTLSLEEYNRLLELASKTPKHEEGAPLPYVLKRADLKFHAGNDSVLGTVQLQGETFVKGETKVALTTGFTVLDARQEGHSLPLEQENGTQMAVLAGPSDFSVVLDTGLPLAIETGRASFNLLVPAAGSAQLTLEVPGDHTSVRLNPGLITSRQSQNGKTVIEATLVPGQLANFSWTTREVVAPVVPREVRFLSNIKTLVSVSEADIRLAVLADATVLQGAAQQFQMAIPEGYEVTGATGPTLDSTSTENGTLTLKVNAPAQKAHHFLITLEKASAATKADVPFITLKNSQRDTGEALVEGVGTMELTATEGGSLKRMDFKETNPALRSLSRATMQAAFRYHRQPNENPTLALEWTRFPDSSVLAAVAEHAVVTTLVTNEGRSLTEVRLTVKNQAQPFLKVELPAGASIVSAEVAGEKVKPVEGSDGNRVPLLRAGFRPVGSYEVSFVFMHSGSPFAKKGGSEISLPKMDVPITVLNWEVFLPQQYKVKDFGGDAFAANLLPGAYQANENLPISGQMYSELPRAVPPPPAPVPPVYLAPGQLGGYVTDSSGAVVAGAQVTVTQLDSGTMQTTATDAAGRWVVAGIASGRVQTRTASAGFTTEVRQFDYNANSPSALSINLRVGAVAETVTVQAQAITVQSTEMATLGSARARDLKKEKDAEERQASANVFNLQQRVSGVLPVRVDVPRAGNSYRFVRPLVLDEETKLTFTYKTK
jgi:hypothetical protein